MTRRQQLILFVLGLATVSICTVAFAMAMSLGRKVAIPVAAAEGLQMTEPVEAEQEVVWQAPPTLAVSDSARPQVKPTSTPPRAPTATNTRVPTWTPSPTRTPTATRVPTDTPVPTPTDTPPPPPPAPGSAAPLPASVPPPATPSPSHGFPYDVMLEHFDTGTPRLTRITGMVWQVIDINMAIYDGEPGYQMRVVDTNGRVHLSEVSGIGGTSSTCSDCGDSQRMNMKVEIPPYVPGAYRVSLVRGEEQTSPEVEFTLAPYPAQYVHVHFVPLE
jgi:hypothetical protein